MILMITVILSILVALNFALLKFSCNKTTRKEETSKPFVMQKPASKLTRQSASHPLAPTGS